MYRFDKNGTPQVLKDFIEELVDYESWRENDSVWDFIEQLSGAFKDFLGSKVFVSTFSIQKDPQTVYCLFFFSSHIKGFEKMLEAKWEIDTEEGRGWNFRDSTRSLLEPLSTIPFENELKTYLSGTARSNHDIYEFTLRMEFLPKHAGQIFRSWQQGGKLKVVAADGSPVRKNSFYLAYRHNKTVYFELL